MIRARSWRELDAATVPATSRNQTAVEFDDRSAPGTGADGGASDGPVDGWTDTDEFMGAEL